MRFWQKSLTIKLSTVFLFTSLVTVGVVGYVAWAKTRYNLERLVFNQLNISATLKEGEIDRWFDDQRQAFLLISQSSEFKKYIKALLTYKASEPEYRSAYTALSKYLEEAVTTQPNLPEIFILTNGGKIILSNEKSREGSYENFSNFTQLDENSELVPSFYPSSVTGQPRSTLSLPLLDPTGKVIGLVATNLSLERIDSIIRERTGLGDTGQTYLVGKLSARNAFISKSSLEKQDLSEEVNSFGIDRATSGIDSSGLYLNHQKVPVIGVYRWLDKRNLALLGEMQQEEAFAPANQLALGIIIVGLCAAVMLMVGVYLLRILEQKAEQIAQANQKITNLNERLKVDNIRMSAELDMTRRLQQIILPKQEELEFIEGIDIAGFMEPADEVGGDYYDVINCEGRIKIGIGDVTGHGLESGVLMIMAQTAVRTLLENNETDSKKFLAAVNRTIYKNANRMNSKKNMTLAMLDYTEGVLTLSGQHEEIIVVRSDGEVILVDTEYLGFPIGLVEDIADFVASTDVHLNSGDVVVLYTDGITEAIDINEVQYGLERLVEVVAKNSLRSVQDIKQAVIDDLKGYIGLQKVYDDITILVIKQK